MGSPCHKTVVGGKQEPVPCRIHSLQQIYFAVLVKCHGNSETIAKLRHIWHPQFLSMLLDFKQCLSTEIMSQHKNANIK